ncbi:MAG TPA: dispase autolysis-inducing protein [Thermoanaerobaculia bacterium]|nr:dispase autolysis-inducing protein [Thermoanaerobaculia bacterium]
MKRLIVVLLLLSSTVSMHAAGKRRAVGRSVQYPPCSMVTGSSAVTFTRNEGFTLAPLAVAPQPISYTYGVAAMIDEEDTLVAWHRDDLLISTNAGCSWRVVATIEGSDFPPKLEPAKGGRVYAWSENRFFFVRYDARGAVKLRQPVEFVGVNVDANNADRVRAGGSDGTLWESVDAGETWNPIGTKIAAPLFYRFVFNPNDLDHIVAGTTTNGAYVSRDGGRNWTQAAGFGTSGANVFHFVFSPVDGNRVWSFGINLEEGNNGEASHGRHIYLSDDGGATYTPVVDEAPGVKLTNGPPMAAHPINRDVLYFIFGTHIFDYGTDLFRYDHAGRWLTLTHSSLDDVNAITFSRKDPRVMYLGIENMD